MTTNLIRSYTFGEPYHAYLALVFELLASMMPVSGSLTARVIYYVKPKFAVQFRGPWLVALQSRTSGVGCSWCSGYGTWGLCLGLEHSGNSLACSRWPASPGHDNTKNNKKHRLIFPRPSQGLRFRKPRQRGLLQKG